MRGFLYETWYRYFRDNEQSHFRCDNRIKGRWHLEASLLTKRTKKRKLWRDNRPLWCKFIRVADNFSNVLFNKVANKWPVDCGYFLPRILTFLTALLHKSALRNYSNFEIYQELPIFCNRKIDVLKFRTYIFPISNFQSLKVTSHLTEKLFFSFIWLPWSQTFYLTFPKIP